MILIFHTVLLRSQPLGDSGEEASMPVRRSAAAGGLSFPPHLLLFACGRRSLFFPSESSLVNTNLLGEEGTGVMHLVRRARLNCVLQRMILHVGSLFWCLYCKYLPAWWKSGYLEVCGNSGLAESWGRCWGGSMHWCGISTAALEGLRNGMWACAGLGIWRLQILILTWLKCFFHLQNY